MLDILYEFSLVTLIGLVAMILWTALAGGPLDWGILLATWLVRAVVLAIRERERRR